MRTRLRAAVMFCASSLGACSAELVHAPASPAHSRQEGAAEEAVDDESFVADVRASGSGCPAGSVLTRISADGQVFTTTFSAFEASITPSQQGISVACEISIKLYSAGGRTYCVKSFFFGGYAGLEGGVLARQTAQYRFQGQPVEAESQRNDMRGPFDDDYLYRDEVTIQDELWTPCAREHELSVSAGIDLRNGSPLGHGYVNVSTADGSDNPVEIRVLSHPCSIEKNRGWFRGPFYSDLESATIGMTSAR